VIRPLSETLSVTEIDRISFGVVLDQGVPEPGSLFSIDIYPTRRPAHPERHLGFWNFRMDDVLAEATHRQLTIELDLSELSIKCVRIGKLSPIEWWTNKEFSIEPLMDVRLFLWSRVRSILEEGVVRLQIRQSDVVFGYLNSALERIERQLWESSRQLDEMREGMWQLGHILVGNHVDYQTKLKILSKFIMRK